MKRAAVTLLSAIALLGLAVSTAACSGSDGSTSSSVDVRDTSPVAVADEDDSASIPGDDQDASMAHVTGQVLAPVDGPPIEQLAADAIVTITLEDITLADTTSTIISTQRTELADGGFPVTFELPYDVVDVGDRNSYRVAARVNAHGDLVMITDTVIPVITRGAPTSDVDVPLVSITDN